MGATEHPRSLNPRKAIAIAIGPIIVHFSTWRARSIHDAQKQLAQMSLRPKSVIFPALLAPDQKLDTLFLT